jgi:hypothetical protein
MNIPDAAVDAFYRVYLDASRDLSPTRRDLIRAGLAAAAPYIAAQALRDAADTIEADYPLDVFLPDGTSPDACAAKGIRVACNRMRHHAGQLEAGES